MCCVFHSEAFLDLYLLASATKGEAGHDSSLVTAMQCLQRSGDLKRHESCLLEMLISHFVLLLHHCATQLLILVWLSRSSSHILM